MSMYRNDGREHSGVGWRAKPHALNMVRASFWSCDCWQKQQKDFWTVQIYSHHSDKCYKCDKTVLIVTQNVLSGQRCGCQDIHLSRDTLSATEDIQIHRRAASDSSSGKQKPLHRGNLLMDSRLQKRFSIPRRKNYSSVHTCPACPNTWTRRWWNLIVQVITDPTEKRTRSSFIDSRNVTFITIQVKSMQFYFVQQNMQIVLTDSKRV